MVETFFAITVLTVVIELTVFIFLLRHLNGIKSLFNNYKGTIEKDSEIETTIEIYQEKILELEEKNKKFELENRLLQEKITKINNQMKQISEHFKTS